ncbi:MAG: cytochrome c maturation protein CcmE [bacterium]|nr:cytochrome c maturation protein CcmE [bacterium]
MSEENTYQEYESEDMTPEQETPERVNEGQIKKRRFRFLIMTLVVIGTIAYLMFSGMQDTMGYYLTVTEIVEQDSSQTGQGKLRVSGTVEEGSMNWSPDREKLQFAIADDRLSLPVEYAGIVPDTLQQGQKVIVEGVYIDGTFIASELMTSCASKYE